jgi:hypothetical protein
MLPTRRVTLPLVALLLASGTVVVTNATAATTPAAKGTPNPLQEAVVASAAPGHSWQPGAATYGVSQQTNVPVTMADGTVLRATIDTPTDKATGRPATGPFPVLLTQTPYGNNTAGLAGSSAVGVDPYFVQRGYIDVAVDVRGTGASGGSFTLFDPQQVSACTARPTWGSTNCSRPARSARTRPSRRSSRSSPETMSTGTPRSRAGFPTPSSTWSTSAPCCPRSTCSTRS